VAEPEDVQTAGAQSDDAETDEAKPRRFSFSSLPARIGAGAAAIAAVVSLVFLLVPSLQPHTEQCGETGAGELSEIRVERGTFAEYLALANDPTRYLVKVPRRINGTTATTYRWHSYLPRELSEVGNIVLYKATIQGFKGKQVELRYSLMNAKRQELLANPTQFQAFRSQRCSSDQFGQPVWIPPLPNTAGKRLNAELLLYSPSGLLLESGRSPVFVGAPTPPLPRNT
jgi:hypothetical protein